MPGDTQGRGRNDPGRCAAAGAKAVYLYPLCRDWRARLGGEAPQPSSPDWAEAELGAAELGDRRLSERLLTLARDCYARPQAQLPQACGSRAKTKAAYRFFDHERVCMDTLLAPHYQATAARAAEQPVVLAVQFIWHAIPFSEQPTLLCELTAAILTILLRTVAAVVGEGLQCGREFRRNREPFILEANMLKTFSFQLIFQITTE